MANAKVRFQFVCLNKRILVASQGNLRETKSRHHFSLKEVANHLPVDTISLWCFLMKLHSCLDDVTAIFQVFYCFKLLNHCRRIDALVSIVNRRLFSRLFVLSINTELVSSFVKLVYTIGLGLIASRTVLVLLWLLISSTRTSFAPRTTT